MMDELISIGEEDERIKAHLNRKEVFDDLIRTNNKNVEISKKKIEEEDAPEFVRNVSVKHKSSKKVVSRKNVAK